MEELWERGEAGVDFECTPRIIEPEHFECMFMIMGCIFSVHLIVLLWDILTNPSFGFFKIILTGLFACLLITFVNLYFFSTVLLRPIFRETEERTISTGDYEYDIEKLGNNKMVAFAIIGYGAFLSIIFIFFAMVRAIGNPSFSKFTFHF